MFGYVKACKPELKIREFELYKSVYCGLCRDMGKRFGVWARFTLSYDFTFLALVAMSLAESDPSITQGRCPFNPMKKINCCHGGREMAFAGDMAILMLWHKLEDDRQDGGFWKRTAAAAAMGIARKSYTRTAGCYPEIAATMAEAMLEQAGLERDNCGDLDKICHPSAHLLGTVLQSLREDEPSRRVLYRLGYLVGRYVYLSDALDDLEEDRKKSGYNPLLVNGETDLAAARERATGSLYMTIAEAGNTLELLDMQRLGSIIENIVFLGLRKNVEYIANPKKDRPKRQ